MLLSAAIPKKNKFYNPLILLRDLSKVHFVLSKTHLSATSDTLQQSTQNLEKVLLLTFLILPRRLGKYMGAAQRKEVRCWIQNGRRDAASTEESSVPANARGHPFHLTTLPREHAHSSGVVREAFSVVFAVQCNCKETKCRSERFPGNFLFL